MDEFDKFAAKEGESLDSVHERLTTLVNIMDRNNVRPIPVAINTKFLNCLQPEWSKYVTMLLLLIKMLLVGNKSSSRVNTAKIPHTSLLQYKQSLKHCYLESSKAPRSKDNRNWNQGSSTKAVKIEDAFEKAMCAIDGAGFDWSDMAEEEIQANMALMAFLDSEYDDLLVKLSDTGFKAATYKRGLVTLEDQIVKYREHEVRFSEEISLLKRSVGSKEYQLGLLKTELEKITEKSKKGVGYNVVPSPHPLILNRPTPLGLSYSCLEEFKEPDVNEYGPRDSSLKRITESVNKIEKPVRKNNDAPIIKDWVSDNEDEVETTIVVKKKTVIPTAAKIEKTVRKPMRYAEMYRSQRPRGNQKNWIGQKSN
ncbi:hypothetical protein Tco_0797353 [Tanacetum coccineum]